MVNSMDWLKVFIGVWFAASVFVEVVSNFVFYWWLKQRGVPVRFIWAGTPGYLDAHYSEWCRQNGASPRRIVVLRWIGLANMILTTIVFMVLVVPSGHGAKTLR
jgi:hypothetical protein